MSTELLTGSIAEHISAINAFDTNRIVSTFAEGAFVNDNRREIVGREAIRRWIEEVVGDRSTIGVRDVRQHHHGTILRGAYDGTYDMTNLPQELILSNYFQVQNGKIVSLIIVFNQPSPY